MEKRTKKEGKILLYKNHFTAIILMYNERKASYSVRHNRTYVLKQ